MRRKVGREREKPGEASEYQQNELLFSPADWDDPEKMLERAIVLKAQRQGYVQQDMTKAAERLKDIFKIES